MITKIMNLAKERRVFCYLAFVLPTMLVAPAIAAEQKVSLVSTEIPGYIDENGGVYREFFQAAAEDAGVEISIRLMPWFRAVQRVEDRSNLLIFPFTRNADREERFAWVARLSVIETGFVTLHDQIDTIEDAKSLKTVIVWRGSSQEDFLRENGFQNLFLVSSGETIHGLLKQGRASAWFGVLDEARAKRSVLGDDQELIIGKPVHLEEIWLAAGREFESESYLEFVNAVTKRRDAGMLDRLTREIAKP